METPAFNLIKPKTEPSEQQQSPAASDDSDIATSSSSTAPLAGNHPFFTIVMLKSQVQKPFQLYIPHRFHRHLPAARGPAVLVCRGRSWTVTYYGDRKSKRLDAAWRDFAVGNRLRIGDACVFELTTAAAQDDNEEAAAAVFQVQVLRGGLPEEITSRGATFDEPIVIAD